MSDSRTDALRDGPDRLMTARYYYDAITSRPSAVQAALANLYGDGAELVASRQAQLLELLESFMASFDADAPVVVARAPGRVNLMGRHIDHRGGYCNTIAIHNDVWVVASRRNDERLLLRNLDAEFPPQDLDPSGLWNAASGQSWHNFVESQAVEQYLLGHRGEWINYLLGAYLRL
ncbi:hypothetical protein FJY63_13590, partial [Candidatus Sumerlaeota bacterium]|nr:hypothetical protein [Candidatus Sumerlaeota bacterium]